MISKTTKVGLVLSGGGLRALLFHLGVLKWCAEKGYFDRIDHVSSVSGGSWCVGCILGHSGGNWPTEVGFLESVLPEIKSTLTNGSLRKQILAQALLAPGLIFRSRIRILSKVFRKYWGLTGFLCDLKEKPQFHFNGTTFETGKRWSFSQKFMGDYLFGYSSNPNILIADAVAASSGFPFAAGPLELTTDEFSWWEGSYGMGKSSAVRASFPRIHIWDGGVYENTGLEPVFKSGILQHGLEFLIVADAAEPFPQVAWMSFFSRGLRLLFIAMEQVRSLRARQIVDVFRIQKNGFYAKIGKSPSAHLATLKSKRELWFLEALNDKDCEDLSKFSTFKLTATKAEFDAMILHGWQTCEVLYGALFEPDTK